LNKALLLLKDNFEKGNLPSETLEFDNKLHGLNSAANVRCSNSDSQIITFVFPHYIYIKDSEDIVTNKIKNDTSKFITPRFKRYIPKLLYYYLRFEIDDNKAYSINHIELRDTNNNCLLKVDGTETYFDVELFNDITEGGILTLGINFPLFYSKSISDPKGVRLDKWLHENNIEIDESIELRNRIYKQLGISYSKSIWGEKLNIKIEYNFQDLYSPRIYENLENLNILSHNLTEQKRVYTEENNSSFKFTLKSLYQGNKERMKFQGFINKCSKLLGIDGDFKVEYDIDKQTYFPNINGKSFLDYGFGYTQIASLIFRISELALKKHVPDIDFFSHEPTILILEEPESNLHPKFQSILADILVDAADTFQIQFIIETHSEYLIRKLQYLTAIKTVKPEDSVIYYFHEPGKVPVGEKQVKKIEILEDGSLSDEFGPGFFDEAANWELELLRLKNNKARNN
jgi:hypothetical protein